MASNATKALIFLTSSLIAGAAATAFVWQTMSAYQQKLAEVSEEDTTFVMVAYSDLYPGITITEEDIFAVEIPREYLHEDGEEVTLFHSPEHVIGRMPRERILANELLREERLSSSGGGLGLNALVPRGLRAVSVNLDDGSGLSGLLKPGNYVDVIVTIEPDNERGKRETHTLLQVTPVLAVNQNLMNQSEPIEAGRVQNKRRIKPSVTLAVTPGQAELLAHADAQGKLTLTLRPDIDAEQSEVGMVNNGILIGDPADPVHVAAVRPREEGHTVTVYHGDQTEEHKYDKNGER